MIIEIGWLILERNEKNTTLKKMNSTNDWNVQGIEGKWNFLEENRKFYR